MFQRQIGKIKNKGQAQQTIKGLNKYPPGGGNQWTGKVNTSGYTRVVFLELYCSMVNKNFKELGFDYMGFN